MKNSIKTILIFICILITTGAKAQEKLNRFNTCGACRYITDHSARCP